MNKNILNKKGIEILDLINESERILLHCHPYPDPDSIGSVLAMTKFLRRLNKKVYPIIGDSSYPDSLKILPKYEIIQDKNYSDINPKDFDLFIILDSSSKTQVSQLEKIIFPKSMQTVVIDHHITNICYGDINLVLPEYSSTSEIIYDLFKLWKVNIDKDMAIYLFLGMYWDTGGFKFQNTSSHTLKSAGNLIKINPDFHKFIFDIENHKTPKEIEYMGLALSSLKRYLSNNVVMAEVDYETLKKNNISKEDTQQEIGSIIKSVIGWNIGINFVEVEKNIIVVSFRTRDPEKYDVSKIAKLIGENGGGHKAAAGTTIYDTFDNAKKDLIKKIKQTYQDLSIIDE
jgi:phosphoesterase RecJ-like protein